MDLSGNYCTSHILAAAEDPSPPLLVGGHSYSPRDRVRGTLFDSGAGCYLQPVLRVRLANSDSTLAVAFPSRHRDGPSPFRAGDQVEFRVVRAYKTTGSDTHDAFPCAIELHLVCRPAPTATLLAGVETAAVAIPSVPQSRQGATPADPAACHQADALPELACDNTDAEVVELYSDPTADELCNASKADGLYSDSRPTQELHPRPAMVPAATLARLPAGIRRDADDHFTPWLQSAAAAASLVRPATCDEAAALPALQSPFVSEAEELYTDLVPVAAVPPLPAGIQPVSRSPLPSGPGLGATTVRRHGSPIFMAEIAGLPVVCGVDGMKPYNRMDVKFFNTHKDAFAARGHHLRKFIPGSYTLPVAPSGRLRQVPIRSHAGVEVRADFLVMPPSPILPHAVTLGGATRYQIRCLTNARSQPS